MIVVLSDTHRTAGLGFTDPLASAVREAVAVVHAGDFTTTAVLDELEESADRVAAVHGNADDAGVRARLPDRQTVEIGGLRLTVVHGHEHSTTALSLLGREADAAVVVSGHTHRSTVARGRDVVLLNPGSHADPRGGSATYATIDVAETASGENDVRGAIRTVDGAVRDRFKIRPTDAN